MKIAIGNDHAGYKAKIDVIAALEKEGNTLIDCGCHDESSCDYPDYAQAVAGKINNKEADFGVVICGSGEGISIAANKVKGIRCGIAYNDEVAVLMKQHNNANIISFGARFMSVEDIIRRIKLYMNTDFEGGRHLKRVEKIEK